jgi:hypothetical protein
MTREEIIEALRQRPKSFAGNVSAGSSCQRALPRDRL